MMSLAYQLIKAAPVCHLLKGKYIKKDCKRKKNSWQGRCQISGDMAVTQLFGVTVNGLFTIPATPARLYPSPV